MNLLTADHYIRGRKIAVSQAMVTNITPLHWHDFFEIEVVLSGKAVQLLNGKKYYMETGYMYMLTPSDFHEFIPTDAAEVFNIMLPVDFLSDSFFNIISNVNGDMIIKTEADEFEEIKKLCSLIKSEYNRDGLFKDKIIENLLECLTINILKRISVNNSNDALNFSAIQKALRYINLHFKDNPTLTDVANVVNYTPHYFSQKFKAETGIGFSEYLNKRKIKFAKLLLKSSILPITEICYASGFSSISNFIRYFRQEEGISPSCYRKQLSAQP